MKYYQNEKEGPVGTIMSPGCKDLPGGYANDIIGQGCWAITGQAIIIGDTGDSVHQAADCCNFNFRAEGEQPCVPNVYFLPGIDMR